MKKKPKLRPLGDITADMEPLLLEMTEAHGLQQGEVEALVHCYLEIHCQDSKEEYLDGTHPERYYGPRRD